MIQSEPSTVVMQFFMIAITAFWQCIYYNNIIVVKSVY